MSDPPSAAVLRDREREVLICMCGQELNQADAAVELGLSHRSLVKTLTNAYARLQVHGIAGACFKLGLRARDLMEGQQS